jgi:hypothetical protein
MLATKTAYRAADSVLNQKHLSEDAAVFISLGEIAKIHLEKMAAAGLPIKKNLKRLLHLKDKYGHSSLLTAIKRANNHNAYGADYIENILYQDMTPRRNHPPVLIAAEADRFLLKKLAFYQSADLLVCDEL